MNTSKINIAFIKIGGLSAGGTEKFLQTVAANLNKERFSVTYFFSDYVPNRGTKGGQDGVDQYRLDYMNKAGVKLVKFNVSAKDLTTPTHVWRNTDFWNKFNEANFDIIQTGRAGHKEYPFTKVEKTPIVDSIHLTAGVDNQYNVSRVMHICEWSAERWINSSGDKSRIVQVSHPMQVNSKAAVSLRRKFNILDDVKIFGFHQRNADSIFSPLPLTAYKKIEGSGSHFVIMGGSSLYKKQASELGIKNITFIEHSADQTQIYSFLKTLDVYAHGRKDGEVNSTAMAEAMYFGLPIVSHMTSINNGHVECVGDAGVVVGENDVETYADELTKLMKDEKYYKMRSEAALKRFEDNYELEGQMKRIEAIYEDVIKNPFPHPARRFLYSLHWTQNIKIWLKWVYLKTKYLLNGKI